MNVQMIVADDTNSEPLSPLHNFLVNTSKTVINLTSFTLSIWINGCYSKYPVNVASIAHIREHYSINKHKITQLIDHNFPSKIVNILNENNNKFTLLCHGYIRKLNTGYIIPNDVINMIDKICIVKYFADLQNECLITLTNIIISNLLTTKQIKLLFDKHVIDILMKSVYKTSLRIVSQITWSLKHIAEHFLNLKPENSISIFENQIYECIKIIRSQYTLYGSVPALAELIESNILPLLRELSLPIQKPIYNHLTLQYEALWALLNFAACDSEYTHYITAFNNNIYIKTLVSVLQSPYYQIQGQALWALGNIAADGNELKDLLLNNDILANIFLICNSKFDKKYVTNFTNSKMIHRNPILPFINLLSTCSWIVSNLCRGSAPPTIKSLYDLIICLQCLLKQALLMDDNIGNINNDIGKKIEIIRNVAWGFSYLTTYDDYSMELMNKMEQLGLIKQFINLMSHKNAHIRYPLNKVIGNILTGSDEHAQKCLDLGILSKYSYILSMKSISQRQQEEICWSLSNVCATDNDRHKLLVMEHGLFKILILLVMEQNTNYETSVEALWAISNGTTNCNTTIINHLVDNGIQNALMSFLRKYETNFMKSKTENKLLSVALKCIENTLIVGQQHQCLGDNINKFSYLFEECGIVTFLKDLQTDEEKKKNITDQVYQKCCDIIKVYFNNEHI